MSFVIRRDGMYFNEVTRTFGTLKNATKFEKVTPEVVISEEGRDWSLDSGEELCSLSYVVGWAKADGSHDDGVPAPYQTNGNGELKRFETFEAAKQSAEDFYFFNGEYGWKPFARLRVVARQP